MGAYRTGAATAVAVKALARPGPTTVALIGTGWQASTQALAMSRVLDIKELRVYSRDYDRRAGFARDQGEQLGVETVAAGSAELAVRGADVIVTITNSPNPVLEDAWVEPHATIVGAGSNFRNRAEIPAELVDRAQTVVVDQLAAAQLESGDLIQAHEAGKFDWTRAVELGPLLGGKWEPVRVTRARAVGPCSGFGRPGRGPEERARRRSGALLRPTKRSERKPWACYLDPICTGIGCGARAPSWRAEPTINAAIRMTTSAALAAA